MQTRKNGQVTIACEPWEKPDPTPRKKPTEYVKRQYEFQAVQERRKKVKTLAYSGKSRAEIRDILGITEAMVKRDLAYLKIRLKEYKRKRREEHVKDSKAI